MQSLHFKDLYGKRVIITGEVGSGKTRLLARLIDEAVESGLNATVLDLAPKFNAQTFKVGTSIKYYTRNLALTTYLRPKGIIAPRLLAKSKKEVIEYATRNASIITPIIVNLITSPPLILFIDDLTIYLHAGKLSLIKKLVENIKTFIATAYSGKALSDDKNSGLTIKEQSSLRSLIEDVRLNILELRVKNLQENL
ncbi:MAG: hypothetical protein QXJ86_00550 [Nitrososphaerales archaeon]